MIALLLFSFFTHGVHADESGTLVVLAKTDTTVFLNVDSRITHSDTGSWEDDPSRKLFNVGNNGACAIEGWNGWKAKGIVMVDDLRKLVTENPGKNVDDLLDQLISHAASTWDGMGYPLNSLPNNRRVGDNITELLCADFISGQPRTFRAVTKVNRLGRADPKRLSDECDGLFYVAGYLDTATWVAINENPMGVGTRYDSIELQSVTDELNKNSDVVSAFRAWKAITQVQVFQNYLICTPHARPSGITWTVENIHSISKGLYSSVEKFSQGVGPPNNTRIISKFGRLETTVEDDWMIAPVKKRSPTQKPRKTKSAHIQSTP